MSNFYKVEKTQANFNGSAVDVLKVGFADPEKNPAIVRDAVEKLEALAVAEPNYGGKIVFINGPASLPVAMAISHAVAHRYGAVACFVPPEKGYVVAVAHGGEHTPGDFIPMEQVTEVIAVPVSA